MQTLMAEGVADKKDIVFLDMDVLVVDSLAEVSSRSHYHMLMLMRVPDLCWPCMAAASTLMPFSEQCRAHRATWCENGVLIVLLPLQIFANGPPFDYGVTLSDAVDMPVNLGMQFVPRGRYLNAIGFLHDVIAIYPFYETFIAGQASHPAALV